MAAVPISAAYVRRLTKTTDQSPKIHCNIQINNDEHVKDQRKAILRSFTFINRLSASCHGQTVRVSVYIEKDDSS